MGKSSLLLRNISIMAAVLSAGMALSSATARGQQVVLTETTPGAGSVAVPTGFEWIDVKVQCWGGGGGGGSGSPRSDFGAGGGGGGDLL